MVNYGDIVVKGSVENVQNLVAQAFAANEFRVGWENATKGKAEKGNRALNLVGGALAQYYAVNFEIYPGTEGVTLRLMQGNSGAAGGIVGAIRVKRKFEDLYQLMSTWFQQQGVYVGGQMGKA